MQLRLTSNAEGRQDNLPAETLDCVLREAVGGRVPGAAQGGSRAVGDSVVVGRGFRPVRLVRPRRGIPLEFQFFQTLLQMINLLFEAHCHCRPSTGCPPNLLIKKGK